MRAFLLIATSFVTAAALAHPGAAIAVACDGRVYFDETRAGVFAIGAAGCSHASGKSQCRTAR